MKNRKKMREQLKAAYQEMAEMTNAWCHKVCAGVRNGGKIGYCCDRIYCDSVREEAELWEEKVPRYSPRNGLLDRTLLRVNGSCGAPPHLRPLCTIHTCDHMRMPPDIHDQHCRLREKIATLHYWLFIQPQEKKHEREEQEATGPHS